MPKLYSIRFTHFAPKGSRTGIIGYVIAEEPEEIYDFLKTDPELNGFNIYYSDEIDDDYFETEEEKENYKKFLIEIGGQMYDENAEVNDAYYGVTHYGWKLERTIQDEGDISILMDYLKVTVL